MCSMNSARPSQRPMATKERAAHKAATEAKEQLEQVQAHLQTRG